MWAGGAHLQKLPGNETKNGQPSSRRYFTGKRLCASSGHVGSHAAVSTCPPLHYSAIQALAKQLEYQDKNHFVIEVESPTSKTGVLELLVGTGASRSILKFGSVGELTVIKTTGKIILGGAFNGTETTLGTTDVRLRVGKTFVKDWKFHIIHDNESIPKDGILGSDFLCENVVMDCVEKNMHCYDRDTEKLVQLSDNLGKEKSWWSKLRRGKNTDVV